MMLTNLKFSILSCYDGHGTVMLYNPNNTLDTHEIHIQNGIEIIAATFNFNTWRTIHVVYKPPTKCIENFLQLLKKNYVKVPHYCLTIFIGDFNVNMLENILASKQL